MPKPINHKQRLWVAAMVKHGSPTRAAEECGLSVSQSKHLASKPEFAHVQEALEEALDQVSIAAGWTRERLVSKFASLADLALVPTGEDGRLDLRAACAAYEQIGKLLGLYVAKHEHSGKLTVADIMGSVDLEAD